MRVTTTAVIGVFAGKKPVKALRFSVRVQLAAAAIKGRQPAVVAV
jgi:hypothetical protein